MKVLSIIGARPQFVKAAMLGKKIRERHTEILLHTGQHYDANMSDQFFTELGIARPDVNLNIGSGSHGKQTGAIMEGVEKVLLEDKFDAMVVYGDTNSTLGGAIAAAKLHVPVVHVEAGLRSFNKKMPEEVNRVLTDHVSAVLLCPNENSVNQLGAEGITKGVFMVGDVMADAIKFAAAVSKSTILEKLSLSAGGYYLATVHRAENTDDPKRMTGILAAFAELAETIVFPVHPRTRKIMENMSYTPPENLLLIEPVGYMDMVTLQKSAKMVLTDSGGLQKEAYWAGAPCVTLRDETEWVETVSAGWNQLVGADKEAILKAVRDFREPPERPELYGDGHASEKCVQAMEEVLS